MSEKTAISWTDHIFNPWWGCEKVSPACAHCYAERDSAWFAPGLWGREAPRKIASERTWGDPLRWDRAATRDGVRRRVFCASMADIFEDRRDLDAPRARLWTLIEQTSNLDWLLLTKRPENVTRRVPSLWLPGIATGNGGAWPGNVWVGTTVEDQARANERIPALLGVPARVRFLSCEPLLGPIDLERAFSIRDEHGEPSSPRTNRDGSPAVAWVIVGGESGPSARPMHPAWARSIRDQCSEAGVAFHFKQWGEWTPRERDDGRPFDSLETHRHALIDLAGMPNATRESAGPGAAPMSRVGTKAAGRLLDGRAHNAVPGTVL